MASQSHSRLFALDGLRGLAAVFVVVYHIEGWGTLYAYLPHSVAWVLDTIQRSGLVSVWIFFLLAGFLMGHLYDRAISYHGFLKKRLLRLYPPFLAFCTWSSIYFNYRHENISPFVWLVFAFACVGGVMLLWVAVERWAKRWVGVLYWGTLALLLLAPLVHILLQARFLPYFYTAPLWVKSLLTWIVNMGMAFNFGAVIVNADAIYWTLAPEIMFYILFPILILPLCHYVIRRSIWQQAIFYLLVVATLWQMNGLLEGSPLVAYRLAIWIYFFNGVYVALYIKRHGVPKVCSTTIFSTIALVTFVVYLIMRLHVLPGWGLSGDMINFIGAFALLPLFFCCLAPGNGVGDHLSRRRYTILGLVSYSIYLSHNPSLAMSQSMVSFVGMHALLGWLLYVVVGLVLTAALSVTSYYLIERRYFLTRISVAPVGPRRLSRMVMATMLCIYLSVGLAFIFVNRQQNISPFSVPAALVGVSSVSGQRITDKPTTFKYQSKYDNLGSVGLFLRYQGDVRADHDTTFFDLMVSDGARTVVHTTSKKISEVNPGTTYLVFGFPPIPDSKDREFEISLRMQKARDQYPLVIVDRDPSIALTEPIAIHVYPKSSLRDPQYVKQLIMGKVIFALQKEGTIPLLAAHTFLVLVFTCLLVWYHRRS